VTIKALVVKSVKIGPNVEIFAEALNVGIVLPKSSGARLIMVLNRSLVVIGWTAGWIDHPIDRVTANTGFASDFAAPSQLRRR